MINSSRLKRLLAAQRRLHAMEATALAGARARLAGAEIERHRAIINCSGENAQLDPGVVSSLCHAGRAQLRATDLARAVGRQADVTMREGQLVRQLERLVTSRAGAEQRAAVSRELAELMDRIGRVRRRG